MSCLLLLVTVLRLSSSDYFTSEELAESTSTSMSLHVLKAVAIEFNQISLIKETQQSNQKLQTCHHASQLHSVSRLIVLWLLFTDHRLGLISKRGWSALIYLHSHQDIRTLMIFHSATQQNSFFASLFEIGQHVCRNYLIQNSKPIRNRLSF